MAALATRRLPSAHGSQWPRGCPGAHPGCGGTVLLDLTRSRYTLIEKYVYDIAMFHFARMNIHDIENHAIEFWCKSKFHTHTLHVDCDESLKQKGVYVYPILSCVTYLNDVSCSPTTCIIEPAGINPVTARLPANDILPELSIESLLVPADCMSKAPDVSEVIFNPPEVSAFIIDVIYIP